MILIINVCKEKLHYREFVLPIENIVSDLYSKISVKHYKKINKNDLKKAEKVIICGTSLKDNEYISDIKTFDWIKNIDKPILGICAGMQIIGKVYGGELLKSLEIGFYFETFNKEFLGLKGDVEVYHLHNNYISFKDLDNFIVYSRNKVDQAVKHKTKKIYGVLFHPEVRNKELIKNFIFDS